MIFFEVLTGKVPFADVPRWEIFQRIKNGKRPALPSEAYCPEYLSAFIRRCWATEAKERPEFPDICQTLVHCKELILRDSFPTTLNCIVQNDAQKLSSFLGPKCCFEKVYSFMVFAAYNNGDHRPDRIVKGRKWCMCNLKTKLINDTRQTLVLHEEEASNGVYNRICVLRRPNEQPAVVLKTNPYTRRTRVAGEPSFYVLSWHPEDSYSVLRFWSGKKAVFGVSIDEMIDCDVITIRRKGYEFIKDCKPRYEHLRKNSKQLALQKIAPSSL